MLLCPWTTVTAQEPQCSSDSASFTVNFRLSKWDIDRSVGNNAAILDSIDRLFTTIRNDSIYRLRRISFTGGTSPDGSLKFNRFLSEQRARSLFNYLDRYGNLNNEEKAFLFLGRDWEGVLRLAESDEAVPYREETMDLLRSIAAEKRQTGMEPARSLERLKRLHNGEPYLYLCRNIFPAVRASRLVIGYDRVMSPVAALRPLEEIIAFHIDSAHYMDSIPVAPADTLVVIPGKPCRPFYMDVRSNMLFDALALPNIGVEFYLGNHLSVGGSWLYAWWSRNSRHRYWRAYGGELFGRRWLGKAAHGKPLTGHHLGIYGQIYTYDFERGGKGEMGGKPGGNLWEKAQWGAGIEYGYSFPVSRRINIDCSLGLGYTTGYYHTYKPADTHYVWLSTRRRKWFGPTKAEISLVWLIGCDNYNRPKAEKGGGDE